MKAVYHRSIKVSPALINKVNSEMKCILDSPSDYDHYLVSGSVQIIPLVSPNGKKYRLSGFSNGPEFKECLILQKCPAIRQFLDSIPGKKLSCRISIMEKGTEIHPHRDYFRSLEFGVIRLHLPIQTDPKIFFQIENRKYHLNKGRLHYVNISKIHQLINPIKKNRIHIIVDLEVTRELLKYFRMENIQTELVYLNLPEIKEWYALHQMSFDLPNDKIPFPLSLSQEKWSFKKFNNKWCLTSGKYKYAVSMRDSGHYYLESVGPGFYFQLKKNAIVFTCHGITTVGSQGISNEAQTFIIRSNKPFVKSPYFFKRSFDFIQIKHFSDEILLVKKDDPTKIYFLNGKAKDLWKKNQFIEPSKLELKDAIILKSLGIIKRLHRC